MEISANQQLLDSAGISMKAERLDEILTLYKKWFVYIINDKKTIRYAIDELKGKVIHDDELFDVCLWMLVSSTIGDLIKSKKQNEV